MEYTCNLVRTEDGKCRTVMVKTESKDISKGVGKVKQTAVNENGLTLTPTEVELQLEALESQLDNLRNQQEEILSKIENVEALIIKVRQGE